MKNLILSFAVLMAHLGFVHSASAKVKETGPLWSCQVEADLDGFEGGFIVVVKWFEGQGEMRCRSVTGDVLKTFPIYMSIKGAGLGAGFSTPKNLKFVTADVGVTHPSYLYGQYSGGLSADGTLINVGGTVGVGVSLSKRGASVRGVLAGGEAEGLMGAITGSVISIDPL